MTRAPDHDSRANRVVSNTSTRTYLLLLDEVGYLTLKTIDATFLFQVVSRRYEAGKALILTSNKSYGSWHGIFPDFHIPTPNPVWVQNYMPNDQRNRRKRRANRTHPK